MTTKLLLIPLLLCSITTTNDLKSGGSSIIRLSNSAINWLGFKTPLIFLSSSVKVVAINEEDYIGLQYPPVPSGVTIERGWTVENDNSLFASSNYAVSAVNVGNKTLLWLERLIGFNEKQEPLFEVINVISIPPLGDNEGLFPGSAYFCHVNGEYDPLIIVIAKTEDNNTEFITKVKEAWRVNLTAEKFDEVDVIGVDFRCENLGFGL